MGDHFNNQVGLAALHNPRKLKSWIGGTSVLFHLASLLAIVRRFRIRTFPHTFKISLGLAWPWQEPEVPV